MPRKLPSVTVDELRALPHDTRIGSNPWSLVVALPVAVIALQCVIIQLFRFASTIDIILASIFFGGPLIAFAVLLRHHLGRSLTRTPTGFVYTHWSYREHFSDSDLLETSTDTLILGPTPTRRLHLSFKRHHGPTVSIARAYVLLQ